MGRSQFLTFKAWMLVGFVGAVIAIHIPNIPVRVAVVLSLNLAMWWPNMALIVKRCHDLDMSGWISGIYVLPEIYLTWISSAALFHTRGTLSATAAHSALTGATAALVMTCIFWLVVHPSDADDNEFGPAPTAPGALRWPLINR